MNLDVVHALTKSYIDEQPTVEEEEGKEIMNVFRITSSVKQDETREKIINQNASSKVKRMMDDRCNWSLKKDHTDTSSEKRSRVT